MKARFLSPRAAARRLARAEVRPSHFYKTTRTIRFFAAQNNNFSTFASNNSTRQTVLELQINGSNQAGLILYMNVRRKMASIFVRLRDFASTERGVTAVEFGLLAPVFIAVTFMIAQLGLYQLYSASLSTATQRAARQILVGNVANTPNITMPVFLNNFVCPNLPPPMSCSQVVVDVKTLTSPYSSGTTSSWWTLMNAQATGLLPVPLDNTKTSFCIGGSGSIVALQMYYAMPTIAFPFFTNPTSTFNGQSVFWIVSTAAFRNEPFNTSYTGC